MVKPTALEKALAFFENGRQKGNWKEGDKLPSLVQLSRQSKFSKNTLSLAIKSLADKGVVHIRPNVGVFFGQAQRTAGDQERIEGTTPKVQHITSELTKDIIEGRFESQEFLPGYKELCYMYGANYSTIKKAVAFLVHDRRISFYKKRLQILRHSAPHSSNVLFLVFPPGYLADFTRFSNFRSRFITFLHHTEKQGWGRNMIIKSIIYSDHFSTTNGFANAAGFVLWLYSGAKEAAIALLPYNKPIFIIDEFNQFANTIINKKIHIVQYNDVFAGRMCGSFLADMGYKRAVFVASKKREWSQQRFSGIQSAYRNAGLKTTSIEYVDESGIDAAGVPLRVDLVLYDRWNSKTRSDPALLSNVNDFLSLKELDDNYLKILSTILCNLSRQTNNNKKSRTTIQNNSQPLKTILIGEDDYVSVLLKQLLTAAWLEVPKDISLIGFNNQPEAIFHNLTSYDFNISALVGRIFEILIGPVKKRKQHDNPVVEVEGFIAVRGSTGPK